MTRARNPNATRRHPWLLLLPLPLTVGAAIGAAMLRLSPPILMTLWLVLGAASAGIVARAWREMTEETDPKTPMPTFTVLSRVDARHVAALAREGVDDIAAGRFETVEETGGWFDQIEAELDEAAGDR